MLHEHGNRFRRGREARPEAKTAKTTAKAKAGVAKGGEPRFGALLTRAAAGPKLPIRVRAESRQHDREDGVKANTEVLEHLAAEVARLDKQRAAAEAEAERAARRLEELGSRREALAPGPLTTAAPGEGGHARPLAALVAALDEESATVSRTRTLAQDAVRGLEQLIVNAQVRQREEEKRLARERFEALCEERYALDGEAEEAIAGLAEVLDRLEELHAEQVRAATEAGDPSAAQHDPAGTVEPWLARRLRRWLANGSLERYDAPLPELDYLARKPGPGDQAR